jgi:hypothetical protein
MVGKALESEIDNAFFDDLSGEGFSRLPGEILSYVRRSADGRSEAHIDVELRDYLAGFGVTLQDVAVGGATRRQRLEDFRGSQVYRFDRDRPETVGDAVAQALADLHLYGMPWLSGEAVSTSATDEVNRLADERRYRDISAEAREKFKRGDHAEALRLFEQAQTVRPLDPLDEKYRALSEKKIAG